MQQPDLLGGACFFAAVVAVVQFICFFVQKQIQLAHSALSGLINGRRHTNETWCGLHSNLLELGGSKNLPCLLQQSTKQLALFLIWQPPRTSSSSQFLSGVGTTQGEAVGLQKEGNLRRYHHYRRHLMANTCKRDARHTVPGLQYILTMVRYKPTQTCVRQMEHLPFFLCQGEAGHFFMGISESWGLNSMILSFFLVLVVFVLCCIATLFLVHIPSTVVFHATDDFYDGIKL